MSRSDVSSTVATSSPFPLQPPNPKTFTLNPPNRQVLPRKLARQLLAPLAEHPYTTINLSGCALGDAAASQAGPHLLTLAQKKCLQTVILSDIIASLPPDEALRTLSAVASSIGLWKGLRSVDLSQNALGSRGVAACAPLLQGQSRLEGVFFADTGLAAESARLLCDYLASGPSTNLRVIDMHGNRLESAGLVHLSAIIEKSPNLKRLRLSSLGASASATATLARALAATSGLTELDISDNALDREGAIALANVLIRQRRLSRLALSDLCMGDDALHAIIVPLTAAQCPISELLLAGNELSPSAVGAVCRYLQAHKTELRVLDLCGNELGDDGVAQIAEAGRIAGAECALTKMLIADNDSASLPIVQLAQELVKLPGMRRYDVRGNSISEQVADALASAFGPNVVVFDASDGTDGGADEEDDELQNALQALADMADVVERPMVSPEATSSQSRSTVSRLVSLFSRGVEEDSAVAPSTKVESVSEAIVADSSRPTDFEDDSASQMTYFTTPLVQKRDVAGVTTSTTDVAARAALEAPSSDSTFASLGDAVPQNRNVTQSARKLRDSIASLTKEITDVADELDGPVDAPPGEEAVYSRQRNNEVNRDVSQYLLVPSVPEDQSRLSGFGYFVDVLGGLLVGVFVVVLVLAIAQLQEDSTFSYRPV